MPSCERNQSSDSPMEQRENQSTILNGEAQLYKDSKEDTDADSRSRSSEIKKSDNSTWRD